MLKIQYWLLLLLWFSEVGKAIVRDTDLSACFLQLQTGVLGEKSRLNVKCTTAFPPSELCCIWQIVFWKGNMLSSGRDEVCDKLN